MALLPGKQQTKITAPESASKFIGVFRARGGLLPVTERGRREEGARGAGAGGARRSPPASGGDVSGSSVAGEERGFVCRVRQSRLGSSALPGNGPGTKPPRCGFRVTLLLPLILSVTVVVVPSHLLDSPGRSLMLLVLIRKQGN